MLSNNLFSSLKEMVTGQPRRNSATTSSPTSRTTTVVKFFNDSAPSWDDLELLVTQKQQQLGITPPDLENGPANSLSLRRTFNKPGEPTIKLYRDHAAWCPYCHKVVLQLEEKQIPYTIEKINMRCYGEKPREFLSKVPSGLLPVLEINGTQRSVITESAVIQQVLEQMFPDTTPMLPPPNSIEAQKAGVYMRLERRLFSAWLQWLCYKGDNASNKAAFISVLQQVEDALGQSSPESPFFLDTFSLVDITFAPFLERIAASIYYYKGFVVRGEGMFPRLEAWFAAMERRPSYLGFKSDYYTHCHDLPPQLGGCIFIPEAAAATAAVDGTDGTSWHLPLPPLDATYAPEPHSVGEQPDVDRLAAAAKLVSNREKVVPFALRGPGKRDIMDARYAQLCDPNAKPRMEFERPVDAALRHVAHALLVERVEEKLQGDGKIDISSSAAAGGSGGGGGSGTMVVGDESGAQVEAVVASLSYMRDRVCVPRDLSLPAARQFRAHVNWVIDQLVL